MEWFRRAKQQLYRVRADSNSYCRMAQDFYTEDNLIAAHRADVNGIAVAEDFVFLQPTQFQLVSEFYIRHIGEAMISVRAFQLWHMTAAVIGACSIVQWFLLLWLSLF